MSRAADAWNGTYYAKVPTAGSAHRSVGDVSCPVCNAPRGELCMGPQGRTLGTHYQRRHKAKPQRNCCCTQCREARDNTRMNDRVDWDSYFMNVAGVVATRATCDRKHVGAVIVLENHMLTTGYNGSMRGLEHCDDAGHLMEHDHCVRTVHAEANAIVQAARLGIRIDGATLYVTASPCFSCLKLIANAGIVRIVCGEFYRDERVFEFTKKLGITLVVRSEAIGVP